MAMWVWCQLLVLIAAHQIHKQIFSYLSSLIRLFAFRQLSSSIYGDADELCTAISTQESACLDKAALRDDGAFCVWSG